MTEVRDEAERARLARIKALALEALDGARKRDQMQKEKKRDHKDTRKSEVKGI